MFSQKSFQLISRLQRSQRAGKRVLAVKSRRDKRSRNRITCRFQDPETGELKTILRFPAHEVDHENPDELVELLTQEDFDVFGVDEIQFFNNWFIDLVKDLAWNENRFIGGNAPWRIGRAREDWVSKDIVLAGLDLTAWRTNFGITPQILNIADEVKKLTADCFVGDCGREARFTQIFDIPDGVDASNPVAIGDYGRYEARCGVCWRQPGS